MGGQDGELPRSVETAAADSSDSSDSLVGRGDEVSGLWEPLSSTDPPESVGSTSDGGGESTQGYGG
jgi:hypothetical protein